MDKQEITFVPSLLAPTVSLISRVLARQEIRYLIAGGWNTFFGTGCFFFFYWLLHAHIHYMIIAVFTNILAVTMAYVTYKLFVFKTRGNIIREYLKFYSVYSVGIVFGLAALPFCMEKLHLNAYLSQTLILAVTIVFSFIGHKRFSFKARDKN